jgi:hypothetical protein
MYRQPKRKLYKWRIRKSTKKKYGEQVARMERNINIYRNFELEIEYVYLLICHSHVLRKPESTRTTSKCSDIPFNVRDKTAFSTVFHPHKNQ